LRQSHLISSSNNLASLSTWAHFELCVDDENIREREKWHSNSYSLLFVQIGDLR